MEIDGLMKRVFYFLIMALAGIIALHSAFADNDRGVQPMKGNNVKMVKTIFAGGCFWCMEKPFEQLDGVVSVISGYTGGGSTSPNYENYSAGGHIEAVEIVYDPAVISYDRLLDVYWRQVDPTDQGGQFVDRGHEYTPAIFYTNDEQKKLAINSKANLDKRGVYDKPIVTPILAAQPFYPAEAYHQDYYKKNPIRYKYYRYGSSRDKFLDAIWGKKRKEWGVRELRQKLTEIQYEVTQEEGTEPAFRNEYWDNHKAASTWILYPANRFSARLTSTNQAPAGQASANRSCPKTSLPWKTGGYSCLYGPKYGAKKVTAILATSLMTARRPPANATALTRRPCVSFRRKILKKRAASSSCRSLKKRVNPA